MAPLKASQFKNVLDEIQEQPKLLSSLRYFYEEHPNARIQIERIQRVFTSIFSIYSDYNIDNILSNTLECILTLFFMISKRATSGNLA